MANGRDEQERCADERKVPCLDTGTEESQSERNVGDGQSRCAESTSETKTVQKAEGESHQPGLALCQSVRILVFSENLVRDEENTERNDSFDRSRRHVDETESGERQGDGMRKSEGADGEE